jgi:TPP-dependent pyruvate/acetoin dehydrogenase alpha subunit
MSLAPAGDLQVIGLAALRMMMLIREFEGRLKGYADQKLIRGSTHPSVGMEAVAVGVSLALEPQDSIASNHRGHAHCLARGADPGRTLAEIFGRADGYCSGKGGSMHIGVKELGILGTNGIVGAGIGLATGAALAASIRNTKEVAVAYFGDGASNQGILAESMNLAAIWQLPVLFVCENNQYAQSSSIETMVAQTQISRRGGAFGVPAFDVDGMDVLKVYEITRAAADQARTGHGPSLIVADTYRYLGHMADDTQMYRQAAEVADWRERDPISLLVSRLKTATWLTDQVQIELEHEAKCAVDSAEQFARSSPTPRSDLAFTDVSAATHGALA